MGMGRNILRICRFDIIEVVGPKIKYWNFINLENKSFVFCQEIIFLLDFKKVNYGYAI